MNKAQKNRCVFCGSLDYGKGCRFGPHGVHFHPEDTLKCAYCGSKDYGKGCRLNPTNNLHVHGGVYNNMYKESVQSFMDESLIINLLQQDYTDFECFKQGIIDSEGNKIKQPITEQEQNSYTSFVKTILRIKKFLGPKTDLLVLSKNLKESHSTSTDITKKIKFMKYRDRLNACVNNIHKTIDEAQQDGMSLEEINELLKA